MESTTNDEKLILNNNTFNIIYEPKQKKSEVFYSCTKCGELYSSKHSAKEHKCPNKYVIQTFDVVNIAPISDSESIIQTNNEKYALIIEKLIRFVCVSNIPLRCLDNDYFRQALYILDKNFDFPLRETMAKRIKDFADIIKNKTYEKIANQKVSLLFDSATKWSKNYQAVICHTNDELYLLSLKITENNKAETITPIIVDIIKELQKHNSIVISVCTDNDNTNKSIFDHDKGIIQKVTGDNFIRQPCCAHIANLAIEDMFIRSQKYHYIYKCIHLILLNANPHNLKRSGFPHIQTIRWNSLYSCVQYIMKNEKLNKSQIQEVKESFDKIESTITWKILLNMLKIIDDFISFIEKDDTNLAEMMNHFIYAYRQLSNEKSKASQFLAECLFERFYTILNLPAFAFLLTKKGLEFIGKATEEEREVFINFSIEGLKNYMSIRDHLNIEKVLELFDCYLKDNPLDWFSSENPCDKWKEINNDLGMIACEILSIPCSEAAVERLFSYLSSITSGSMYNSSLDMTESRLLIHLDSIS